MSHNVKCTWKGKMAFEADITGHKIMIDTGENAGGENRGPIPKPLILVALAGCTGMDVTSLLKKMRVEIKDFNLQVNGDLSEEHPKYYTRIHLVYEFTGKDLDKDKIEKAVKLSQEKYCGVNYMLRKATEMDYEIVYNEI
ncbi:MAG: OsmC family protein [Bacteroidota bacterium]